jgi:predicted Zn-dependent peptidase
LAHYEYLDAGLMMTYLSCDPDVAGDNLRRVQAIYSKAEAEGINAAELARAKSKICSRIVLSGERPRGRLSTVGGNWIQRQQYRSVRDDLDVIEAVRVADVMDVLRRYPLTSCTTVAVGPLNELSRLG